MALKYQKKDTIKFPSYIFTSLVVALTVTVDGY